MNILDIPLRQPGRAQLTWGEVNAILLSLRGLHDNRRVEVGRFGGSFFDSTHNDLKIQCYFDVYLPPFSIFTLRGIQGYSDIPFYYPKTLCDGDAIIDPPTAGDPYPYVAQPDLDPFTYPQGIGNPPTERDVFLTNGGQEITVGMSYDCEVVGTDKPHKILYSGSPPIIGERMEYVPDLNAGKFTVIKSRTGPFVCVGNVQENHPDVQAGTSSIIAGENLVWIIAHLPEIVEIPWVRTTTSNIDSRLSTYPSNPLTDNTFVVERGMLIFNRIPGAQSANFIPYFPRQLHIAFNPCGYLEENSVVRMSYDRGHYYLFRDCPIVISSSSSSSPSSSSISSSSISLSSSSIPSSSIPSQSSSSLPPPPPSSSSESSSSISSQSGSSRSFVSNSSFVCQCDDPAQDCKAEYLEGIWNFTNTCTAKCEPEVSCHCEGLPSANDPGFEGQVIIGTCLPPP